MGYAEKLSFIDTVIASVRNTAGYEWRLDQLQAALDQIGRLVTEITDMPANRNIEGLDVLGDLVDQAAMQCALCAETEPSEQDMLGALADFAVDERKNAALEV